LFQTGYFDGQLNNKPGRDTDPKPVVSSPFLNEKEKNLKRFIMKYDVIVLEKREHELLKRFIGLSQEYKDQTYKAAVDKLRSELLNAMILADEEMPEDVVRFNSTVTIVTPFNVEKTYQIVTPDKSDIRKNMISVLAPMGLGLFGYAEGDEIQWQFPAGIKAIEIKKVLRPATLEKTNKL